METWIHRKLRAVQLARLAAWGLALVGVTALAASQQRYIQNFIHGPFPMDSRALDAIADAETTPHYFVRVTGREAIDTGVQQVTVRERFGVETGRRVSAVYYALLVGDRVLLTRSRDGMPLTLEGSLEPIPADLDAQVFDSPDMESLRSRFYPYYLEQSDFRFGGYLAIGLVVFLSFYLVRGVVRSLRWAANPGAHPLLARVAGWGDPLAVAVEVQREAAAARVHSLGWRVTDHYAVLEHPLAFDVLRLANLLWVHKLVRTQSAFFIPIHSYTAVLRCSDGECAITGSQANVDSILELAAERVPWAVFGHSRELEALYREDTRAFAAAVEQRRCEQSALRASA